MAERSHVEVIADVLHQLKDELILIVDGLNFFSRFATDIAAKGNELTAEGGVTQTCCPGAEKRRAAAGDGAHQRRGRGSVR